MLDFGWSEFFLIIVLAIVMMGPKDIPEIIYNLGRLVRRAQYIKFAMSKQFDSFMEQMDLHDLKKGGGLGQMSARGFARDVMNIAPLAQPVTPQETAAPDTLPQAEFDDDEEFYATLPLEGNQNDDPSRLQSDTSKIANG